LEYQEHEKNLKITKKALKTGFSPPLISSVFSVLSVVKVLDLDL
jgi:hypothetical protein